MLKKKQRGLQSFLCLLLSLMLVIGNLSTFLSAETGISNEIENTPEVEEDIETGNESEEDGGISTESEGLIEGNSQEGIFIENITEEEDDFLFIEDNTEELEKEEAGIDSEVGSSDAENSFNTNISNFVCSGNFFDMLSSSDILNSNLSAEEVYKLLMVSRYEYTKVVGSYTEVEENDIKVLMEYLDTYIAVEKLYNDFKVTIDGFSSDKKLLLDEEVLSLVKSFLSIEESAKYLNLDSWLKYLNTNSSFKLDGLLRELESYNSITVEDSFKEGIKNIIVGSIGASEEASNEIIEFEGFDPNSWQPYDSFTIMDSFRSEVNDYLPKFIYGYLDNNKKVKIEANWECSDNIENTKYT